MEENHRLKMAIISGASHALEYKEKNPRASTEEIIQHITENAEEIVENIDEEI